MLIGVDWGGTKIEVAALSADNQEQARVRSATPRHDYDACVRMIVDLVGQVERATGESGSIGVGLPGSLDPHTGVAKGASSTWMNGRRPVDDLEAALGRPIRAANDADCFAVSEAVDGAGVGHRVVFAVILGSGAGAGIAIDGVAHHGPNNSAGEWGHNPLPVPDVTEIPGPACYCGRHGCLERWVSGWSFARDYAQHAQVDLSGAPLLSAPQVMEKVRAGDRLAALVWGRYLDRVARGLALVVNTLDPDVIVMGGGMSNVPELYEVLPALLAAHIFSPCFYTPIVAARHGDSSGVRGAAWLWREEGGA